MRKANESRSGSEDMENSTAANNGGGGRGIGGFSKKGLRNTPISFIEVSEMMKRFQAAHSAVRWRRGASRGLK